MKFEGFIGAAYELDSSNVDAQACVNLYPEMIESGRGKAGQVAYLRATPGLEAFEEVGDGPIRLVHVDSIGRILVVSGPELWAIVNRDDWSLKIMPVSFSVRTSTFDGVDVFNDTIFSVAHGYHAGLKVRVSSTATLPAPLAAATDYWVTGSDPDRIKLATTLANAVSGTAINLTNGGTDPATITITPLVPAAPASIPLDDISVATDLLTSEAHGLYTGQKVRIGMNGEMPTGLAIGTNYYVIASSANTLKFASSIANASAGTAIDITAVSSDEWSITLVGADGPGSGDPMPLSTSSGSVKAASMSFGGEGTDSSTLFVDGVNNYLFKDDAGAVTFSILGEVPAARATFNIDSDITATTTSDVSNVIANAQLEIHATVSGAAGTSVDVIFSTGLGNNFDFSLDITLRASATLTTAELVQALTYGFVTGKTVNIFDTSGGLALSQFLFAGGDAQSVTAAFGTAVASSFSSVTFSGEEYGSVPTATDIVWSDGYFILAEGGTNRFRVSDLQSFNIDALSFASSEGSPDIVLAVEVVNRTLYVFNEKTTEVYANTGNADFPFERVGGGFIEVGCLSPDSVCKVEGNICWLGRSEGGDGIVYALNGMQPVRISTHAIEQAIRGYAAPETASAYSYHNGGHVFYVLNFTEATWVYDLTTKLWHRRAYTNAGALERHRAQFCSYIPELKLHLVSDYSTNELFTMSESVYADNGSAITRLRSFPYISNGRNRLFCSSLLLDMETGIGLDGGVQGSNPTVILDWSNDGGHTWSSESWALADAGSGAIGDYSKRVIWNRLGSFRSRIFRIKITDPVKVRLIDAQIEVEGGLS